MAQQGGSAPASPAGASNRVGGGGILSGQSVMERVAWGGCGIPLRGIFQNVTGSLAEQPGPIPSVTVGYGPL